jgi:hypothetical protein
MSIRSAQQAGIPHQVTLLPLSVTGVNIATPLFLAPGMHGFDEKSRDPAAFPSVFVFWVKLGERPNLRQSSALRIFLFTSDSTKNLGHSEPQKPHQIKRDSC